MPLVPQVSESSCLNIPKKAFGVGRQSENSQPTPSLRLKHCNQPLPHHAEALQPRPPEARVGQIIGGGGGCKGMKKIL